MGKIYDALEKSQRKRSGLRRSKTKQDSSGFENEQNLKANSNIVKLQIKAPSPFTLPDESLVTYHDPYCVESELFKLLRTNIHFPENGRPPRTILVTSTSSDEGKTFTSSNLAYSIAQGIEEHVLLIDCDLRRSSLHQVFGIPKELQGLSDFLKQGLQPAEIIYKTFNEKLSVIPGGSAVANPTELLSSKKFANFLEEAKNRYKDRYIIIDSPPPQIASETKAISRLVDGILLVVKNHETKKKLAKDIVEEFGKEKIIGVAVNQIDKQAMRKHGYHDLKKYRVGSKESSKSNNNLISN